MKQQKCTAVYTLASLMLALGLAFSCVCAIGACPGSAYAAGDGLVIGTQSTQFSGTCGSCRWRVHSVDEELVISPLSGDTGTLGEYQPNASSYNPWPWVVETMRWTTGWVDAIKHVRFEGNIKAVSCEYLFAMLGNLETIDFTGLDTSSVTSLEGMFDGCSSLKSVDLSTFASSSIKDMTGMFKDCKALTTVYVSDSWQAPDVTDRNQEIFHGCEQLVGGKGTKYATGRRDADYARADAPGQPGYFTLKSDGGQSAGQGQDDSGSNAGTHSANGSSSGNAKASIASATISGLASKTYNGKLQTQPGLTVKLGGKVLRKNTDYAVSYNDNFKAGTATVKVTGKGSYTGSKTAKFTIAKAPGVLDLKVGKRTLKAKALKKAKRSVKPLTVQRAIGAVSFKKVGGSKKLSVNKKTGKVTVKKRTKKGTYKAKVRMTAAGGPNYEAASKTVTVKVRVK